MPETAFVVHGADDVVREVAAGQWTACVEAALAEGHTFLDLLDAVDEIGRSDELRVVLRLVDFSLQPPRGLQLHTLVPRDEPVLDSVATLLPGAAWHEREVHDMFGVRFTGGDDAPLLVHEPGLFPLRKDFVLAARSAVAWPGAKEPGDAAPSRRRMSPPGVPDPAVWGDRDPQEPAPDAGRLAAEVSGGRVRRRR